MAQTPRAVWPRRLLWQRPTDKAEARIAELERLLGQLTMENAPLKKAAARDSKPAAPGAGDEHPRHRSKKDAGRCRVLRAGMPLSTYYRAPPPESEADVQSSSSNSFNSYPLNWLPHL
jgi:hypothetical protein